MKEYNQYCDEQVNQNNEMEMFSRTEQNPNSRIRLEPAYGPSNPNIINLSEQNLQSNHLSLNNRQDQEANLSQPGTINQSEGTRINNLYEMDVDNLDLLIPHFGEDEKVNFYHDFSKVESNKNISRPNTEIQASDISETHSDQTHVINFNNNKNTAEATHVKNKF